MAEHTIKMELPSVELGPSDVTLEIREDGSLLGRAKISKGGIDWYPPNARNPVTISWSEFAEMMTARRDE